MTDKCEPCRNARDSILHPMFTSRAQSVAVPADLGVRAGQSDHGAGDGRGRSVFCRVGSTDPTERNNDATARKIEARGAGGADADSFVVEDDDSTKIEGLFDVWEVGEEELREADGAAVAGPACRTGTPAVPARTTPRPPAHALTSRITPRLSGGIHTHEHSSA